MLVWFLLCLVCEGLSAKAAALENRAFAIKPKAGTINAKFYPRHITDPQSAARLDPSVIQTGLIQNGIVDGVDPATAPSLTSANNFINFCLTQNVPLTDGKQVLDGSCSPTPMGRILGKNVMPTCKFQFPKNGVSVEEKKTFTVRLAVRNFQTGWFANPSTNYFGAPQTVDNNGLLEGHSHVVIEAISALDSEDPPDPLKFTYFKGMNAGAQNGVLSVEVTGGLEVGIYRMSSISTATNHQPVLVSVAQHGQLDDTVYFRVLSTQDFNNTSNVTAT